MNITLCVVNGQACRMILHWASLWTQLNMLELDTHQTLTFLKAFNTKCIGIGARCVSRSVSLCVCVCSLATLATHISSATSSSSARRGCGVSCSRCTTRIIPGWTPSCCWLLEISGPSMTPARPPSRGHHCDHRWPLRIRPPSSLHSQQRRSDALHRQRATVLRILQYHPASSLSSVQRG